MDPDDWLLAKLMFFQPAMSPFSFFNTEKYLRVSVGVIYPYGLQGIKNNIDLVAVFLRLCYCHIIKDPSAV